MTTDRLYEDLQAARAGGDSARIREIEGQLRARADARGDTVEARTVTPNAVVRALRLPGARGLLAAMVTAVIVGLLATQLFSGLVGPAIVGVIAGMFVGAAVTLASYSNQPHNPLAGSEAAGFNYVRGEN